MTGDWPYPAPRDDGGARHLTADTAMPDIALPATTGGEVSLARLDGATVVFAYPWTGRAGIPNPPGWDDIAGAHGSTPEAEGFRDHFDEYCRAGIAVFGLSLQSSDYQRELATRLALPYALLSDEACLLQRALALPVFATGGVTYLKRLTLVIRDGRLERVVYPVHPPHTHAWDLLTAVSS